MPSRLKMDRFNNTQRYAAILLAGIVLFAFGASVGQARKGGKDLPPARARRVMNRETPDNPGSFVWPGETVPIGLYSKLGFCIKRKGRSSVPKTKTRYVCQECGYEAAKWLGRCPGCG
ncbi:MAG: hypothetical protein K6T61_11575, partial [Bryobacteraceae bacterium]|nr:hypothetical protein [Bryobacteraceae bacterium]